MPLSVGTMLRGNLPSSLPLLAGLLREQDRQIRIRTISYLVAWNCMLANRPIDTISTRQCQVHALRPPASAACVCVPCVMRVRS